MPRYRVTLRRTSVEIVEAANPYQAAITASQLAGAGVEIENVVPAVGRPPVSPRSRTGTPKATKKVTKKRRPMSAENRAKLAQNLVKARAARAAKREGPAKKKAAAKKQAAKRR